MIHNQKGFTLTELMVTLVISSIVLVAVVSFFISGIGHNKRYEESRNNQEVINVISDLMYRDIMEADLSKACEPEGEFNLISISINNECHHYYIESEEESYILKYQKDDGSFILAGGIVNPTDILIENNNGFFIITLHLNKMNPIRFHVVNEAALLESNIIEE